MYSFFGLLPCLSLTTRRGLVFSSGYIAMRLYPDSVDLTQRWMFDSYCPCFLSLPYGVDRLLNINQYFWLDPLKILSTVLSFCDYIIYLFFQLLKTRRNGLLSTSRNCSRWTGSTLWFPLHHPENQCTISTNSYGPTYGHQPKPSSTPKQIMHSLLIFFTTSIWSDLVQWVIAASW